MYKHFFKRFFDFWIALIALICISPILIVVTIWLHFANKGAGAFFFQERPGKNGKIFKVIKFKTMTDEKDAEGNLLPDADRCWCNIFHYIAKSKLVVMRLDRVFLVGRNVMDVMQSRGRKSLSLMCGM